MKILTIIVSYNFTRWITPCLDSLSHSTYPTDVLVIDNGSKDKTLQIIGETYPHVRLLANGKNLGFGRANNTGMQLALQEGYDAVFLLNQDAWISPGTLEALVERAAKHPEYGILSPVHLNGKGNRLDHGFASYVHQTDPAQIPQTPDVIEAAFINAAFWFIPVDTLKKTGGFSPLFYHYGEDKDYVNRLHHHGLKVGYVPVAFGYHDRQSRPVTREIFFRTEYVYLLSEYTNLNRSFGNAFAYSVLACIKKSLPAFARLKIKDGCTYLRLALRLAGKTRQVKRVRRETEKEGPHFL